MANNYLTGTDQPIDDREFLKFKADANNDNAVNVVSEQLNEVIDLLGGTGTSDLETLQFAGSVGLSNVSLPVIASGELTQVILSCRVQSPSSRRLLFSLDGGVTFFTLSPGSMVGWEPKDITQVIIKGNAASVDYDILINRKA